MQLNREIIKSTEHIKNTLDKHIFEFEDPGVMRFADSNIRNPEYWEESEFRVLVVFLSTLQARAIAATDVVLFDLIYNNFGKKVYPDLVYLPEKENFKKYEEYNLPVIFGAVTNRSWEDFDLILISNSTLEEKVNLPWMLHHSGLPIWYTQRIDKENIPLILLGGNSADFSDIVLGESDDGKDFSLIDGAFIGMAEGMIDKVIKKVMKGKEKGLYKKEVLRSFFEYNYFLHPEQFQYKYKSNGWHIDKVVKNPKYKEAPSTIYFNRPRDINKYPGFSRKILHPNNSVINETADIQISWGCTAGNACCFCKEGSTQGGWQEKSIAKIEEEIIRLRSFANPSRMGFFSYNTNYYSKYMQLMSVAAKYFRRLTFIAMRADVVAARPDYFDFNRAIGQRRISFGVEGISERIRNGYLNKGLTEDELLRACEVCFRNRFIEVKMFLINTGLETKEDMDEFARFIGKLKARRNEVGSKAIIRLSVTALCYYTETPLQWEKRITVEDALNGIRTWAYFFKILKEGYSDFVRMDIANMTGTQFIYQQIMLDLHRRMTPILVKASLEGGLLHQRYISPDSMKWLFDELSQRGYKIEDIIAERPDNFIFPNSYIFTLDKKYLKKVRDHSRAARDGLTTKGLPQCLATPAKPDKRKCVSCGYCKDSKEKKKMLVRKFDNGTHGDEALQQVALNLPKYKILVKLSRNEEYRFIHPSCSWIYCLSRIFREMGTETVLKVQDIDNSWEKPIYKENTNDFITGTMMGVVALKEKLSIEAMEEAYKRVSKEIKTCTYMGARYVPLNFLPKKEMSQILVINLHEQNSFLRDKLMVFDGKVKKIIKCVGSRTPKFVVTQMEIPEILYIEGSPKVGSFLVVSIPYMVSPFAFLSSVTGMGFTLTLSKSTISRICYYIEAMTVCEHCGSPAMFDLYENLNKAFCDVCYRKYLVAQIKERIECKG